MTINLSGELIPDEWAEVYSWFGIETGYFSPKTVRDAIENLEEGEELTLEINSVGGSVDAGSEIYSVLQKCNHPTRAEIQSMAASAASYMILSCDRVEISITAQMMIHRASCGMNGNAADHEWASGMLRVTDATILDTYCARCGEDKREELRALMDAETFLSASDALRLGLVDAIIGKQEGNAPQMLAASIHNNIVRAMRTLPDIHELMARRDAEREAVKSMISTAEQRYKI